jgi:putative transcriptional regulator
MSKGPFESIKAGLEDALAYARGDTSRGIAHEIEVPSVNVRAVRTKLGLSQPNFARMFRVSVATVRNWEQGRRRPEGPARVLLMVIEREPEAVKRALTG